LDFNAETQRTLSWFSFTESGDIDSVKITGLAAYNLPLFCQRPVFLPGFLSQQVK